ncbi:MAG: hypothetical protein ACO39Y_11640, partial [Ilumatobacteraceae bacterium]
MIALGECSGNELGTVAALAFLVMPSERSGEGVQVECVDGHRVWTGATKHGEFRVQGEAANFSGRHLLHLRLVRDADSLVDSNASAEILIDGNVSRVVSGDAMGEMPLATVTPDVSLLGLHTPTRASITIEGLRHVLSSGTHDPAEGFSDEESGAVGPSSLIHFGAGSLGVSTSFAEVGCASATSHWAAEMAGPRGAIGASRWSLRRLLGQLYFATDTTISLATDVNRGGVLTFRGDSWRLALPEAPTRAGRYYEELLDRLEALGALAFEHPDGRLTASYADTTVSLQLLDGRMPIVRCTSQVVSDVERTAELLSEIDQQNEGRAFTKYFMSGSSVFASVDLRCTELDAIEDFLRLLVDDSELL